jgi:hypothetical protein
MPSKQRDLTALCRIIHQAELSLGTIPDPHPTIARSRELLTVALKLADDLATVNPAAALGSKGGVATAKRGAEYFSKIAAMRKTRGGGRPSKQS